MEYIECSQCRGQSLVPEAHYAFRFEYCKKCMGMGKLNWLENIFGKKQITFIEVQERIKIRDKFYAERRLPKD